AENLTASQCRDVLTALLDARALSASALLARRSAQVTRNDPTAQVLQDRLTSLRRRLANRLLQGRGDLTPPADGRQCEELQQQADEVERDLVQRFRAYADFRAAIQADAESLINHLAPGTALLELVHYWHLDFRTRAPLEDRYACLLLARPRDA